MLEILLIIALSRRIAAIAKDKGRGATGWVILFILLWVGGEFSGGFAGAFVSVIANNGAAEPNLLLAYGCAIAGAAIGAISAFVIVKNLPSLKEEEEYWEGPDSDAYREKFDARKAREKWDTDAYRAKDKAQEQPADDEAYRRKPDELQLYGWDRNALRILLARRTHMTAKLQELGLDRLGIEERLELAQELWDSVATDLERQPLTPAQRAELERRVAAADARPEEGVPWDVVRTEARARWQR